jgi:hypothetical protein
MRTILAMIAVFAVLAGGARWWYDRRMAAYEEQLRICLELEAQGMDAVWNYQGPMVGDAWKWFGGPLFAKPTHIYCDDAQDDAVANVAIRLSQVNVQTLALLGRQIIPQARAAKRGESSDFINALRTHRTLTDLVVDSSIRGTPVEFDAPIYTREDLALLQELLPNVEVHWIDVN